MEPCKDPDINKTDEGTDSSDSNPGKGMSTPAEIQASSVDFRMSTTNECDVERAMRPVDAAERKYAGPTTGAERLFGTAATVALCAAAGVSIVRVHDVPEMLDVVKVSNSIR